MTQGAMVIRCTQWTPAKGSYLNLSRQRWGRGLVLAVLLGLS
jgi:hypothetical protein